MQRDPHQNVATVLVDPRVLRDLELDLMTRDLWLWPVATAPVCADGPRTAFQIRRRMLDARRGEWDDAAEWEPVWISFGESWHDGAEPLPWSAHQTLWRMLDAAYAGHVHHQRRLGGIPRLDLPHDRVTVLVSDTWDADLVKVDLTVLAIPAYVAAIAAEVAWQRAHPVAPGTRAGDYQTADTLASLSMGAGSLVAPYRRRKAARPGHPGRGKYGRALLTAGAAAAVLTTVGDVVRRRVRDGRLPDPQTVPDDVREVQEELAALRQGPAVPRVSGRLASAGRGARRPRGGRGRRGPR